MASSETKPIRFVASLKGRLRIIDEKELVRLIRDYTKGHWHTAVEQCLILSKQRPLGQEMEVADFERFDERVLKP